MSFPSRQSIRERLPNSVGASRRRRKSINNHEIPKTIAQATHGPNIFANRSSGVRISRAHVKMPRAINPCRRRSSRPNAVANFDWTEAPPIDLPLAATWKSKRQMDDPLGEGGKNPYSHWGQVCLVSPHFWGCPRNFLRTCVWCAHRQNL